jgi:hypothetical protein
LPDDAPLFALAGDPAASRLAIMLDPKDGGPIYQGIVALEAASIAALIEHYLTASEQIESRLVLAAEAARVRGNAAPAHAERRATTTMPRGGGRRLASTSPRPTCSSRRRRGPARGTSFRATTSACSRRARRFRCDCSSERDGEPRSDARPR